MERSLIWIEGDATGWACSNCPWRFSVPTLLSGKEARDAYDRLAAVKFWRSQVRGGTGLSEKKLEIKPDANLFFAERARMLIKRGYKAKDAVELILQETEIEHRNEPKLMEKARADAEDFLLGIRTGLI
jgi:hypothetical protein